MATVKQLNYYRILGASEDEVAAFKALTVREAISVIADKIKAKIPKLVAGIHIDFFGRRGVILSQFLHCREKYVRVRWENGRGEVQPVEYFAGATAHEIDPEIAAQDAFERKVFEVIWRTVPEKELEIMGNFSGRSGRSARDKVLSKIDKVHGRQPTEEQIVAVVAECVAKVRLKVRRKWERRFEPIRYPPENGPSSDASAHAIVHGLENPSRK